MACKDTTDPMTATDLYAGGALAPSQLPLVDSEILFGDSREIQISHRGEIYRLRITAQQKLILTK
ncbi:hemin uptake protein HemP [uncultured Cohaesibacter sp.]|uniref:hemin uptake protein HemP n=1 Tax=uncultured Cohaesibacter sp. TaxID=1002546 RepID=UPI0029C6A178|nr:hemin uptake protein HemP [uncultured Cohaesibacter sp.]